MSRPLFPGTKLAGRGKELYLELCASSSPEEVRETYGLAEDASPEDVVCQAITWGDIDLDTLELT